MKKYLISEHGKFYKANLHSHSTVSDGELTPEQMKELYQKNGYSIIAYTDHCHFVTHNELSDENFLALNGVEDGVDEVTQGDFDDKVCDICYISMDENNKIHPLQDKSNLSENPDYSPMKVKYCSEDINAMIKRGKENGFFVTYNHPTWSLENYERYMSYNGMHCMEIFNFSSSVDGYNEYNGDIYNDMLKGGKRIFCIATDDNHNRQPGTLHWDSFGGFTMIKAKDLSYKSVADALLKGDFYSSTGAVIKALWLDTDDYSVHIQCENAVKIIASRANRRFRAVNASEEHKQFLDEVKFSINKEDKFFRFIVIDKDGKEAYTNAYFIDELDIDFNCENIFVE